MTTGLLLNFCSSVTVLMYELHNTLCNVSFLIGHTCQNSSKLVFYWDKITDLYLVVIQFLVEDIKSFICTLSSSQLSVALNTQLKFSEVHIQCFK